MLQKLTRKVDVPSSSSENRLAVNFQTMKAMRISATTPPVTERPMTVLGFMPPESSSSSSSEGGADGDGVDVIIRVTVSTSPLSLVRTLLDVDIKVVDGGMEDDEEPRAEDELLSRGIV